MDTCFLVLNFEKYQHKYQQKEKCPISPTAFPVWRPAPACGAAGQAAQIIAKASVRARLANRQFKKTSRELVFLDVSDVSGVQAFIHAGLG